MVKNRNFFLVIGASNSCSKFDVHYRHQVTTYAQHFPFFTFTECVTNDIVGSLTVQLHGAIHEKNMIRFKMFGNKLFRLYSDGPWVSIVQI